MISIRVYWRNYLVRFVRRFRCCTDTNKKKNTVGRKRKSKPRTIESMMMKSKFECCFEDDDDDDNNINNNNNNINKFHQNCRIAERAVDVDVLMALPENIRAEVLESLHNNNNKSPTRVVKKERKRTKLDSWLKN